VSNYSLNYYNGGQYPIPHTILVFLFEFLKFCANFLRMHCTLPPLTENSIKNSFKFVVPSLVYAVNNNIYLATFLLVSPPIWVILISFRTVVTACSYKFILRRKITVYQIIGAVLIVLSIVIAKIGDVMSTEGDNNIPAKAILYALIFSLTSVAVSIYQETLFKGESEKFVDQQFWLYFYGMMVTIMVHFVSAPSVGPMEIIEGIYSSTLKVQVFLCCGLFFTSVGGLIVAAILKNLDCVVKEYSVASANLFTAAACSYFFPDKFILSFYIFLSLIILGVGIFLYEKKDFGERNGEVKESNLLEKC